MSRRKSYQIRVDEGTKKMLDSIRGDSSYNNYIYHLINIKKKYDKYLLCSKLIHSVDRMEIDWIISMNELIEYQKKQKIL